VRSGGGGNVKNGVVVGVVGGGGLGGVCGGGIKTKGVRMIVSLVSIMLSKTQCHYLSVFSYFQAEI